MGSAGSLTMLWWTTTEIDFASGPKLKKEGSSSLLPPRKVRRACTSMFSGKARTSSRKVRSASSELAPIISLGENSGTSEVKSSVTSATTALSAPNASTSKEAMTGSKLEACTARKMGDALSATAS